MGMKNVVFDVGGVFVTWEPRAIFRKHFKSDEEMEQFIKDVDFYAINEKGDAGQNLTKLITETAQKFPQYSAALLDYDNNWIEAITNEFEGTRELAHQLQDNGYKIFILSNWEGDKFRLFDSKYKIIEFFDGCVVSGDIKKVKPYPEIYQYLLKTYNLKARESVFLDDRLENVQAAKSLGFEGFVFTTAAQAKIDLETLGIELK
jgi:2-haloacid dehalogenase